MVWLLRYCDHCDRYTLRERCPLCGGEVRIPHPAKFSLDDRYQRYKLLMRRMAQGEVEAPS
ncbi:RNA-protein complex protein Nop10 [Candidatus Bathyarchaeota archaeon]|nr:MAG: RNA-protein complex protein Nop10 [Candidatus Bathyarchaeota archaeon]